MRLWHEKIIKFLPKNQLIGQHRECCALRGKGWGRKHSTVDYVFTHSPFLLYKYHLLIIEEMTKRGYKVSKEWLDKNYRGKNIKSYENLEECEVGEPIYFEHNFCYLEECILNLKNKNIEIHIEKIF